MKIVKRLLKVLLVIVLLAIVAVLTLPLWFGPVGKCVANAVAPKIVKTDFHLGHLGLNPYKARFELGALEIANPSGYSEKYAVTLGDLVFDARTSTLASEVIEIEELCVKDIFISYVFAKETSVSNLEQIRVNVMGEDEETTVPDVERVEKTTQKPAQTASADSAQKAEPEPKKDLVTTLLEKKYIIDRLEVSNLTLKFGPLPIRLPSVVLTDIGRSSGGASLTKIWEEIVAGVMKAAGFVGDQVNLLGGITLEAANSLGTSVRQSSDQATKAATEAFQNSTKDLNEGVKALNERAKKAAEALKGLW